MWRSGEKHFRQKVSETRTLTQECACMGCAWSRGKAGGVDEVRELPGDKRVGPCKHHACFPQGEGVELASC